MISQAQLAVQETLKTTELPSNGTIWIGWSGGLDSTSLVHACIHRFGIFRCKALHINHNISPLAKQWEEHCRDTAAKLGIELVVVSVTIEAGNLEMQARLQRYKHFKERLTGKDDVVLTAHHQSDVVETRLWQLFTGRAAIGIPYRRQLGQGSLIRPFLRLPKCELLNYAVEHKLKWIEDKSNFDQSFDRNWIRHKLIPDIEARFPSVMKNLSQLYWPLLPEQEPKPLSLKQSDGLSREGIRAWLLSYGINPDISKIDEILKQTNARQDALPEIQVSTTHFVRRYRDQLYVTVSSAPFNPIEVVVGECIELSNGLLDWRESERGFIRGKKILCTNRSNIQSKQRKIQIGGMHKRLSSVFQEQGIPPWLRDGWPLLLQDEYLVCVPNLLISDKVARNLQSGSHKLYEPRWFQA